MLKLRSTMENLFLTVLILLYVRSDLAAKETTCNKTSTIACDNLNASLPNETLVCKSPVSGNDIIITVECNGINITYYCDRHGQNKTWNVTEPDNPCQAKATTENPATSEQTTTLPISMPTQSNASAVSSSQTNSLSDTISTIPQTSKQTTEPTTQQDPVTNQTQTHSATTEKTTSNPADNTTKGITTSESSLDSDDKASVVAAAVSVSVVAVIFVVLVVAFLLWRKRRQKSTPAAGLHSGNSLTNRSYEDRHGLDRHISLLNIRSNQSVDSGYSEIPLENLRSEETTGNVYQTIDILPDDQIECNGNYGHLEMKTTAFVDNNYSHIPINQANGNVQQDSTYAHTGGATLKPDMENKGQESENTYNILENMPNMTIRGQETDKVHESNTDENESEYNHATARRSDSSGSKADTYSHLNRTWQNRPASSHNDMKPISEGGENQSHNSKGKDSDFGKANGEKNIPDYAKCIKKKNDTENPRQVGSDGYEKASGIAHEYFVLEPDNSTADNETSFRVIEDNCVDNPDDTGDAENPYHQYFTLEKTN